MKALVAKLLDVLPRGLSYSPSLPLHTSAKATAASTIANPGTITQNWFWHRLAQIFRPGDVVVADPGTSTNGLQDPLFPPSTRFSLLLDRSASSVEVS